jgi:hypothetical protein
MAWGYGADQMCCAVICAVLTVLGVPAGLSGIVAACSRSYSVERQDVRADAVGSHCYYHYQNCWSLEQRLAQD